MIWSVVMDAIVEGIRRKCKALGKPPTGNFLHRSQLTPRKITSHFIGLRFLADKMNPQVKVSFKAMMEADAWIF